MTEQNSLIVKLLLEGRIIDPVRGCWKWSKGHTQGYGSVSLGTGKSETAHRLAAMVWLGYDLDSELHVLHDCDIRDCFNPEHLFFGTNLDNIADKVSKNRQARGLSNPRSLDHLLVDSVVSLLAIGEPYRAIGRLVGISHITVRRIARGEHWTQQSTERRNK